MVYSPGSGDAAAEPGGGDEMGIVDVQGAFEPTAPGVWAFVRWAVQVVVGGNTDPNAKEGPVEER